MRGKPFSIFFASFADRITPADAGKTPETALERLAFTDHPRGCGENISAARRIANRQGSPPRMRGKPAAAPRKLRNTRITPADAGKTMWIKPASPFVRDHPRGCGENVAGAEPQRLTAGSPPRMRGKLMILTATNARSRITPADAGKTLKEQVSWTMFRDHPRGCGENGACAGHCGETTGITPADAGKTHISLLFHASAADHPRGCGENVVWFAAAAFRLGSPPRMRGKPKSSE